MRILLSWLRDFVDVDETADALARTLGLRGFELAAIEETGRGDAVIDLEITANRPDCLSVAGIAREAATTFQRPLRALGSTDALALAPIEIGSSGSVRVSIEDPDLCPRYAAAVAEVKVAPSPAWLASRLEAAGVRPINNVVDVTNYVLMELGQPMHAFDLAKLGEHHIRVRRAKRGETLRTLDGQDRALAEDMLVIADERRAQAIAGVMGGAASEVSVVTTTIVLESACFEPRSVRQTSKRLGLKTEASARFERGTDIDAAVIGLARACALLERIGAGHARGPFVDAYPSPKPPRELRLRRDRIRLLLGAAVPDADVVRILTGLGFVPTADDAGGWRMRVPTWRVDVLREADLIEELGRHFGYDRLAPTFPPMRAAAPAPDVRIPRDNLVRRVLTAAGFSEAVSFAFLEERALAPFAPDEAWQDVVAIGNPLSAKFAVMRRTLMPGLIDAVAHNRRHGRADVRLFEIGTRFSHASGETRGVAMALTGAENQHWSGAGRPGDFFDAKGIVEQLGVVLGTPLRFETGVRPYLAAGQTANVLLADGRTLVGEVGQLVPAVTDARGLPRADRVYVAELNLDALWYAALEIRRAREGAAAAAQRPIDAIAALPRFPSIVRDISVVVDARLPAENVRETIAATGGPFLADVREFDRYQGKGVPEGRVSLSLRLTFRSDERTLTDDDVQQAMTAVLRALAQQHGAVQR